MATHRDQVSPSCPPDLERLAVFMSYSQSCGTYGETGDSILGDCKTKLSVTDLQQIIWEGLVLKANCVCRVGAPTSGYVGASMPARTMHLCSGVNLINGYLTLCENT